jgi:predicted  nucleic acid-binding Zn-ribbon protein
LDVAERLEHFGLAKGINRNILQQKLEAPTTQEGFQKADPLRTPDQERLERWLKEVKEAVKVPPADRTEQEIFRRVLSEYPNASYLGWGEIYTQEIQAALEEAKKAEAAAKEAQAKAEREAEREKQRADQAQRQLQDLERQLAETREKLRAATTTAAQVPDLEKDKATLEAEITQKNQELATLRKQLEQVTTTASAEKTSLQQQIHQLTQTKANLEAQITQKNQELATLRKQLEQVTTTASAEKTSLQQQIHQLTQTKANLEAQITQKNQELANLQAQRTEAEFQKKYSYFASIKKLVNRYKNPQIGTDREGEILLPDQTLKFSELNGYSLESLQEVYQTTRRKIERDLERRIGQLPPISQQIIGLRPLTELPDEGLIELFPRVLQLEQSKKEEQQRQEAERKRLEQELERRRLEQERQHQELARAKLAKFKRTQKLLSLSGLGETGENWYRFENLLITEEKLREFPLEELEKIYQATSQLALKKFQELAAKFWKDWQYCERVWEISKSNLPLENKLEELLKIRDAVAERSFREINSYLGEIQQFRKDFRIDLDLAKIPKEQIVDLARNLEETYFFYAEKYANLQKAISTYHLDQAILDFLIRKFELKPSEEKLKELLTGKEVQKVGEIQRKIAKSLLRKFSAETGKEPKDYDFDGLIWDYRVKVSEIQERLIRKLQSKGLETLDLETSDLEKLAGQVKEILKGEREKREADRKRKLFFRSDRSPRRQREDEWGR